MIDNRHFKTLLRAGGDNRAIRVGFVLIPEFSLLAFTSAVDPLRSANRLRATRLFEWILTSADGKPVMASNGVEVATNGNFDALSHCDIVFACGGVDIHRYGTKEVLACLRFAERRGAVLGAICTGTWLLAKAGLLHDKRCTIHWENIDSLAEEFADLEVVNDLFEIDGNRITCSGGTAALDMILCLIASTYGNALARGVSEQFIHERIRSSGDGQRMGLRARLGVSHPKLLAIVAEMEANLEDPLPQNQIARRNALSIRQMERLFRQYLNTTPARYYLKLRLGRAKYLLQQTSMSILSIALACGFISASHFSKCYREVYGHTPRAERTNDL